MENCGEPSTLTEDELIGVSKIREAFGSEIPDELNTDFNLRRWWLGHDKQIDVIKQKMGIYLQNRKVLGFDKPDFVSTFYEREDLKAIMQYFGMSRISKDCINKDGALMFVESGEFDSNVIYTSTVASYLKVFFSCCELVLQTLLEAEKRTGRACYGICIFDMGKVSLTQHMSPFSSCNKVFTARAMIWEDYYPGMIKNIFIVNPPMLLPVVWSIAKFLLAEKQRKLLHFCRNSEPLLKLLGREYVPVAFGGDYIDTSYSERKDCCNERKEITQDDHYVRNSVLKGLDVENSMRKMSLKIKANGKTHVSCAPIKCPKGYTVIWQFTTKEQIEFAVFRDNMLVYPRLKFVTLVFPEEDALVTENETDLFVLEFTNYHHHESVVHLTLVAAKADTTELPLTA